MFTLRQAHTHMRPIFVSLDCSIYMSSVGVRRRCFRDVSSCAALAPQIYLLPVRVAQSSYVCVCMLLYDRLLAELLHSYLLYLTVDRGGCSDS